VARKNSSGDKKSKNFWSAALRVASFSRAAATMVRTKDEWAVMSSRSPRSTRISDV
jgi:hypothetical protein